MSKVFLGVGHGGKDPGAVGYIKEADVNLNMALACKDFLIANGVEVKMSRIKDEDDDLSEEIRECNEFGPDLAVDIHNNAGGGDGFEVYHSIFNGLGATLAKNIETEIIAIGQNSRGIKTRKNSKGNADYYGFIRNTKAPAVIVEGVFVDNKEDAAQADTLEEQKAFGVAYAKGILKTLGIAPQETKVNAPQETLSNNSLPNLSNYKGSSIVDGLNSVGYDSSFESRKQLANKLGITNYTGTAEQNTKMISLLQGKTNTHTYLSNPNYKGSSIVDALNQIGVDSSFAYRKKLAQKNNVRDYEGSARQNNQLLDKLKAGKLIKA